MDDFIFIFITIIFNLESIILVHLNSTVFWNVHKSVFIVPAMKCSLEMILFTQVQSFCIFLQHRRISVGFSSSRKGRSRQELSMAIRASLEVTICCDWRKMDEENEDCIVIMGKLIFLMSHMSDSVKCSMAFQLIFFRF